MKEDICLSDSNRVISIANISVVDESRFEFRSEQNKKSLIEGRVRYMTLFKVFLQRKGLMEVRKLRL